MSGDCTKQPLIFYSEEMTDTKISLLELHGCHKALFEAKKTFHKFAGEVITCYCMVESFTRAMPDEYKHDTSIDTFTAYKNYIRSKPWVASNYLRDESRKPDWLM